MIETRSTMRLHFMPAVLIAAFALTGCFGPGDGPERIPGTPAPPPPDIPPGFCDVINFEEGCGPFTFADFGGGVAQVIANPFPGELNDTSRVGRMLKFSGEVFAGSTLSLADGVDFAEGTAFTMKVWSQRTVPVLFKFEGLEQERSVNHPGGSAWQQLCFDFSGATAGPAVTGLTLIFDLGVIGNANADPGNWTFYFDEITQVEGCEGGGGSVGFPIDFEGASQPAFANFEGGVSTVIANPVAGGINTSDSVARMQKFAGAVFAGSTLPLAGAVDFTAGTVFTMKVWSQRPVPVLFKFEGLDQERSATHGGGGTWESLCFDFTGSTAGAATTGITFIFDLGVPGNADGDAANWTFYFDDIEQVASCDPDDGGDGGDGGEPDEPPLIGFEDDDSLVFLDFEGGVSTVIGNPVPGGINTTANVARMQKFAGAVFAGSTLPLDSPPDFTVGPAFTMAVWSQRAVEVLFKLEGLDQERSASHGGSGWELLCFDFSGSTAGAPATGITFIFDLGVVGAAGTDPDNWTFYFDNIRQAAAGCGGGAGGAAGLPIDFEDDPSSYVFRTDGGFAGGQASVIDNPEPVGNPSAQVGQMLKFAGEVFGGATLDLDGTLDLPPGSAFTMNVWSQREVPVLFKLEGGPVGERTAIHGGSGWETLCFDFGPLSGNGTDGITLIFDLGVNGAAATDPLNWTFYFDDIDRAPGCEGGAPVAFPVDFEGVAQPAFANFEGGVSTVIANPVAGGINTSDSVARMQKFAGAVFAGSTLPLAGAVDFTAGTVFTMKVWSQRPVPVLFKFEGLDQERSATHAGGGTWESLCFDFTGSTAGPLATGITFIFDLGVSGNAGGDADNWTFYFDDIDQVGGCGG